MASDTPAADGPATATAAAAAAAETRVECIGEDTRDGRGLEDEKIKREEAKQDEEGNDGR